jgi:predicted translin family RNA/ssDNA-binding protein
MKANILKTVLVVLALSSTSFAQAQIDLSNDYEHQEAKVEASAYNQVTHMKKELDSIYKKISDLQEDVGITAEDSQGVIKALGEKMDMTDELRTDFVMVAAEMQKQSGSALFESYGQADKIIKQARKHLVEAKKLAKLVK